MCCQSCFSHMICCQLCFFPRKCCHSWLFFRMSYESYFFLECATNHVFPHNLLPIMFFPRMCCHSCFFFSECTANHVFRRMCCQSCFSHLYQVRSQFSIRRLPSTNHNTPLGILKSLSSTQRC
jgi:hypothetical protein